MSRDTQANVMPKFVKTEEKVTSFPTHETRKNSLQ